MIQLQQQVEMLQRRIWGKSSERYFNEDPLQRKLDFEGLDLLPKEKELATNDKEEIEKYKTIRVVEVKDKKHPTQTIDLKPAERRNPHLSPKGQPEELDRTNSVNYRSAGMQNCLVVCAPDYPP